MPSDGKSSHCLWQGELIKITKNILHHQPVEKLKKWRSPLPGRLKWNSP
jgi:hypothetical protein